MHGMEEILENELLELGANQTLQLKRAVKAMADLATIYRINYRSYFALRVLVTMEETALHTPIDFYELVKSIPWEEHFDMDKTFAVNSIAKTQLFNNSHFVSLRTKDAIVDRFSEMFSKRPSVDVKNPDLRIHVHLFKNNVTISLDSSGESLHKRGYKIDSVPAPLNEVLAAGLVKLSQWDYSTPFWDPMCGSGTLVCEALLQAFKNPPQDKRRPFAFKSWKSYDESIYQEMVKIAHQGVETDKEIKVVASDRDAKAVRVTQFNLAELGLLHAVTIEQKDFFHHKNDGIGYHIMMNPPYDERLPLEDDIAFYQSIGDTLKSNCEGSVAWIVSANIQALKRVGLRPSRKIMVFNGPLESRFHKFEMYAGSRK